MVTFRGIMGGEPMDYASSGVDIDAEGKAISSLIDALGGSVTVSYTHLTLPTNREV